MDQGYKISDVTFGDTQTNFEPLRFETQVQELRGLVSFLFGSFRNTGLFLTL